MTWTASVIIFGDAPLENFETAVWELFGRALRRIHEAESMLYQTDSLLIFETDLVVILKAVYGAVIGMYEAPFLKETRADATVPAMGFWTAFLRAYGTACLLIFETESLSFGTDIMVTLKTFWTKFFMTDGATFWLISSTVLLMEKRTEIIMTAGNAIGTELGLIFKTAFHMRLGIIPSILTKFKTTPFMMLLKAFFMLYRTDFSMTFRAMSVVKKGINKHELLDFIYAYLQEMEDENDVKTDEQFQISQTACMDLDVTIIPRDL